MRTATDEERLRFEEALRTERYYETLNDHDDEYVHELCEGAKAKKRGVKDD